MAKYSEKTRAARRAELEGNKDLFSRLYADRDVFDRQAGEMQQISGQCEATGE